MKTRNSFRFVFAVSTLAVCGSSNSQAAVESKSAATDTNAVTYPQSSFVAPANSKDGRDPFFPESERPYADQTPRTTIKTPVRATSSFSPALQGISGQENRRLAIISGRTLAEGENTTFNTPGGAIQVRCLEIRADSVVVEVGTERRELRLKSN
jgi:hypothetical protein